MYIDTVLLKAQPACILLAGLGETTRKILKITCSEIASEDIF